MRSGGPLSASGGAVIPPLLDRGSLLRQVSIVELMHNARLKHYPDGSAELLIGSRPFGGGNVSRLPAYCDDGFPPFRYSSDEERVEQAYISLERDAIQAGDDVRSLDENAAECARHRLVRSVRRAKKTVRDLARSNDWAFFVTLTLSPEKVNRYDAGEVLRHLRHWLGNNVRRKGLAYVLVPEHHKDGAIHFHGLFNDALAAVDSGTVSLPGRKAPVKARSEAHKAALLASGGHIVYNLPGWGWGFSTAIQLYGEKDRAINYVCKYIGKEMEDGSPEKIGGRWYYSGGALRRPVVEWFDVDVRDYQDWDGWFSPEDYPYAQFLCRRISSEGEMIDPDYSRTNVSRETPVSGRTCAEHRSARNAPEGLSDPRGSSTDCADSSAPLDPPPPAFACSRSENPPSFFAHAPRAQLPQDSHFTFSGLSSRARAPATQPLRRGGENNDQLNLFGKDVCL